MSEMTPHHFFCILFIWPNLHSRGWDYTRAFISGGGSHWGIYFRRLLTILVVFFMSLVLGFCWASCIIFFKFETFSHYVFKYFWPFSSLLEIPNTYIYWGCLIFEEIPNCFPQCWISLYSHQQCTRVPVSPHPHQ